MRSFLLLLVSFLIHSVAFAQGSFQLKQFTPETFQAGNSQLITVKHAMAPSELAVIVNTQDAQSVQVANYYKTARNIPEQNIINVSFAPGQINMGRDEFGLIRQEVLAKIPANVQAFALSWTTPWKVDCMSITSAFAFGFNQEYCQKDASDCYTTKFNDYYGTSVKQPRDEVNVIPTIMLAGLDFAKVKSVIDRGVSADLTFPRGDGYFITTTDSIRSSRTGIFSYAASLWNNPTDSLKITHINNSAGPAESNYLQNVSNILFYFTGLYDVPAINTLNFVPGAVADHLTSYGGALTVDYSQMSALRWLEAGATASYGTVVEPCNYAIKFPDPSLLLQYYFSGESLLEGYWKSVGMPGEGVYIGEPLARPWGTKVTSLASGEIEIFTTMFRPWKTYYLLKPSDIDANTVDVVESFFVDSQKFSTIKFLPSSNKYFLLSEDELIGTNTPPELAPIGNKVVNENSTLSFQITASDNENDVLIFSSSGLPTGASFNSETRVFSWKPSYSQSGIYNIKFDVSDGQESDSETISVTVKNVNRAPSLSSISNKTIAENSLLSFAISGSDADGDALTYSASNLPSGATFNVSTKKFSWTPSFSQAGIYNNIVFRVSDGSLSASRSISITVTNTNRAPILNAIGNKTVIAGSNLQFTISGSDPDGDLLTYSATGLPIGASFDALNKTFTWANAAAGIYNVTFYLSDGFIKVQQQITITVNSTLNAPPVIAPIGNKTISVGQNLSFTVLASDINNDTLSYAASALPSGASFNSATKIFSFTPVVTQIGSTFVVRFLVSDGKTQVFQDVSIKVIGKKALAYDYNGDKKSDNSIFRPSNLLFSSYIGSGIIQNLSPFGASTSKPVHGDLDGDGIVDRVLVTLVNSSVASSSSSSLFSFSSSSSSSSSSSFFSSQISSNSSSSSSSSNGSNANLKWSIRFSSTGNITDRILGVAGDLALAGDIDGDNRDEMVLYRSGVWYVRFENGIIYSYTFGSTGDVPKLQDFDGDGVDDLMVFRPSSGTWYISLNKKDANGNRILISKQWGGNSDIAVPADFDKNGSSEIAIWRPSNGTWYSYNLQSGAYKSVSWGSNGDTPIVGDFNADGLLDYTVYRSSNKNWYHNYRNNTSASLLFGSSGDVVVLK